MELQLLSLYWDGSRITQEAILCHSFFGHMLFCFYFWNKVMTFMTKCHWNKTP